VVVEAVAVKGNRVHHVISQISLGSALVLIWGSSAGQPSQVSDYSLADGVQTAREPTYVVLMDEQSAHDMRVSVVGGQQ